METDVLVVGSLSELRLPRRVTDDASWLANRKRIRGTG
jgi:hypothetical protein